MHASPPPAGASVTRDPSANHALPARPPLTGISHVALFSHSFEASVRFYTGFLGFAQAPYVKRNSDGSVHIVWIKINDTQTIELFEEPPERVGQPDRLNHIAFQTPDADGMRRYLAARGVKVPDTTPFGAMKNANFFFTDPFGNSIEIVQYMPDGATALNRGHDMPASRISTVLRHCGVTVSDLDRALEFYCGLLGFKEIWRGGYENGLDWVNLQLPEGDDYIELMLRAPDASNVGVLKHICLEVDDIPAAARTLETRALPADCKPVSAVRTGINRKRQVNCYDPDGTRVEIMENRFASV